MFFHKGSGLGTLFSRRPPLVHKTDPPIFPLESMENNGPKTDTPGQQRFRYLAYIASLSIIYQHVEVYTWVHTFFRLTIIWCSNVFPILLGYFWEVTKTCCSCSILIRLNTYCDFSSRFCFMNTKIYWKCNSRSQFRADTCIILCLSMG